MELSQHVVDFEKRSAIKSQILADSIVEWMGPCSTTEVAVPESPWSVYCDRAWGQQGRGSHHINLTFGNQAALHNEIEV
jgi:hypothetical protein